MTAVEVAGLIFVILILAKHLPIMFAYDSVKNKLRKFERCRDSTISYLFWASLILFIVLSLFIIPEVGLLNFIVSGIVFSVLTGSYFLSRPELYRSLVKEILRQPGAWMRSVSFIVLLIAVILVYLLFR